MGWWGQDGRDIQWQKLRPRGTSAFPQAPEAHEAPENLEREEGRCLRGSAGTRRSCLKEFWPHRVGNGAQGCESGAQNLQLRVGGRA